MQIVSYDLDTRIIKTKYLFLNYTKMLNILSNRNQWNIQEYKPLAQNRT